jgi:hypothetical protein
MMPTESTLKGQVFDHVQLILHINCLRKTNLPVYL